MESDTAFWMNIKTSVSVVITIIFMGLLCFIPAGTIFFKGGWQLIIMVLSVAAVTFFFLKKRSPELLTKRIMSGYTDKRQAGFLSFAALILILLPLLCGIDYRFCITFVPLFLRIAFVAAFILGFILYLEVYAVNQYLYSDIRTKKTQKVIDKGPYRIIRHPMYTSVSIMYISLPISCGSFLGLLGAALLPLIFIKRISFEEKILDKQLKGYTEYKKRVKYKMLPYIW